ncbi:GPP34 family phosphoprotein [Fulvivirgaceae bacterium BMA10]|uniref:GPP34 family phosphoprotein n=1 Tax=Splendidivirga corallicola TaxID=3051826 RepID=A0ABT8KHD7_9BACT|nr:GPP34 family phosphoprotein [Fulvivirgaceae bacterium BMA10]
MQTLQLSEKLILLGIDTQRGSLVTTHLGMVYSLSGILLYELIKQNKIKIDDNNKLNIVSSGRNDNPMHNLALELIAQDKKARKLSFWISRLARNGRKIQNYYIRQLIEKRILEQKEQRTLWIFKSKRYPIVNIKHKDELIRTLKDFIQYESNLSDDMTLLVCLSYTCNLLRQIFLEKDGLRNAKHKIKNLI